MLNLQPMEFSKRLKNWRSENGWSQGEAAAHIGASVRTLQEWEQGRRTPSGESLAEIWKTLGPQLNAEAEGSFCELLRAYRRHTRQSREEAARSLTVSVGAIKDWEQERRAPNGATVLRLLPLLQAAAPSIKERQKKEAQETEFLARFARNRRVGKKKVFATPQERLTEAERCHAFWRDRTGPSYYYKLASVNETRFRQTKNELERARKAVEVMRRKEERLTTRKPRRPSPKFG